MKYLIAILFFSLLIKCNAQSTEKALHFESELDAFRFSLYHELNEVSIEKIRRFEFDEKDSLIIKINAFYEKHEEDVISYRKYKLKEYTDKSYKTNWSEYEKKGEVSWDLKEVNEMLNSSSYLTNLLFINPFNQVNTYVTLFNSSQKSAAELSLLMAKNQIAMPLISTKEIKEGLWEITHNTYNQIYKFTYGYQKGEIISAEVYEHK